MPHYDGVNKIQHVFFHLADSLPQKTLARLEEELKDVPEEKRGAERRKRIEAWIDSGCGSCVLRHPEIATIVEDAFLFFDEQRYRLLAWVVMPNHVHILFQPIDEWTVAKIVGSWKKFTATKICQALKSADREAGGFTTPVWHREYWDRFIRDERHYRQVMEYIHQNPVKASLVPNAEDWCWSSARWVSRERQSPDWLVRQGKPRKAKPPGAPIS